MTNFCGRRTDCCSTYGRRTKSLRGTSAFDPKEDLRCDPARYWRNADVRSDAVDVRFWPIADVCSDTLDVRL